MLPRQEVVSEKPVEWPANGRSMQEHLEIEADISTEVGGPIGGAYVIDFTYGQPNFWHKSFEEFDYAAFAVCLVAEERGSYDPSAKWLVDVLRIRVGSRQNAVRCVLHPGQHAVN